MSVYFYHLPKSNLVKIGVSSNVSQRMKTLNTGCSEEGNLIRVIDDCGFAAEKWLHNYFNVYKVKGEWFSFVKDMLDVQIPVTLKNPTLPPFSMVGNGEKSRMYQAYPLINTLLDLSKPEAWFMKMVFKYLNSESNTARIPYSDLSETEKRVANKAYSLLLKRQLVRKVKLHTYMINPTALITNNFKEHITAWKALDKPKKSKTVLYEKIYVHPKHFWVKGYKAWDNKHFVYVL